MTLTNIAASGTGWTQTEVLSNFIISISMSADGQYQTLALNGGQLSVSSDYGVTRTLKSITDQWYYVDMSPSGQYQIACVRNGSVYLSTDFGDTWTPNAALGTGGWIRVAISGSGTHLLACREGNGVYTSNDSGASWTNHPSISWPSGGAISSDGSIYTVGDGIDGIWRSTNSGGSFVKVKTIAGTPMGRFEMTPDGTKHLMSTANANLYISTDSGDTWTSVGTALPWTSVTMTHDGTKMYATEGNQYIWESFDSGVTWTANTANNLAGWAAVFVSGDGSVQKASIGLSLWDGGGISAFYQNGDFLQISGAKKPENNGLYVVDSTAANVLTIKAAPSVNFTRTAFTANGAPGGVANKVSVSLLKINDGVISTSYGSSESEMTSNESNVGSNVDTIEVLSAVTEDKTSVTSAALPATYILNTSANTVDLQLGTSLVSGSKLFVVRKGANTATATLVGVANGFDGDTAKTVLNFSENNDRFVLYYYDDGAGFQTWYIR